MFEVGCAHLPKEFDGFLVAHVSDLHNDELGGGNARLIRLLENAVPDLIAVTGDLVDSYRTDLGIAVAFIERAARIAPVACVTGNHEARVCARMPDAYAAYEARLADAGASVLHNACRTFECGGARLRIAGIDDPGFQAKCSDEFAAATAQLAACLDGGPLRDEPDDGCTVLLAHRPELFAAYLDAGVDVVLAGHAHGGQFRLPFIGGMFAPDQGFFPRYDSGVYVSGDTSMVVSRGLGNSAFPFRLNNPPEIVLVNLRSVGSVSLAR